MAKLFQTLLLQSNLRAILKTATLRQSAVTFSGTVINGALGALFYILLARALGPATFGLLVVSITSLTLIADVADFGTNTGLVRFVGKYAKENMEKAYRFLKLGLAVKFTVWGTVFVLGWFAAPWIADVVFQKTELSFPLQLASIGVGGALLFSFATHAFQAFQRFWAWGLLHVLTNAARLVLVAILWFAGDLDLTSGLISYIALPFLGFLGAILFLPTPEFLTVKGESSVAREFFHYNKWVATFTILAAIGARLDTFISARLLSATQLGLYSAANQLVTIVPQIVGALGAVIAPKLAGMKNNQEAVSYMKKVQILVLVLAALGLLAIPASFVFIPILYGGEYLSTIPLFVVLLLAMLVFLIAVPVHTSIFYYFGYPKLFVWLSGLHLAIVGILGWNLISVFGAIGAAVTVLVAQIVSLVIPVVWVIRRIRKRQ